MGRSIPRGQYCEVCGQHKTNEQFSDKGHAAHICKECSHFTPAEQAESMTLTRLYAVKNEESGHPAYILLHEIGHALQVELTRDPELIPESFCKMSDQFLGKPVDQSPQATEPFADAFSIGMIQIFGWDYGSFDEFAPEVKNAFATYMNWLLEKKISKK